MKCTFIDSTNKAFESIFGAKGDLSIGMTANFDFREDPEVKPDFEFRHGYMRTSIIEQINYNEVSRGCYVITVKTRNSVYTYQVGEKSDKKPLTKEEVLDMQIAFGMHLF